MMTAHTSAAYLGANIPTGTAAPKTSSIPRSAVLKPVRISSGTGSLSRLRRSGRVTSSQIRRCSCIAAMKVTA
jgi:hypothetical protein